MAVRFRRSRRAAEEERNSSKPLILDLRHLRLPFDGRFVLVIDFREFDVEFLVGRLAEDVRPLRLGFRPAAEAVELGCRLSRALLNLKTAKKIGLEVPPQLLARADEVIE